MNARHLLTRVGAALLIATAAHAQGYGEFGRLGGQAKAPKDHGTRDDPSPPPASRGGSRSPGSSGGPALRSAPRRTALKPAPPMADSARVFFVVRELADPRLEGRGVGTHGLDQAADFVADEMRAAGLHPGAADGTFAQRFEVTTGVEVVAPSRLDALGAHDAPGDRFMPLGFSTNGTLTAPVVFAGYGITAPGYAWDDYAGLDVHDKIVLVLTQEPGEMDSTSVFDGNVNTPHAELRTKAINAREHGALGLLVVNGPREHAGEPLRRPHVDGSGYMSSGLIAAQIAEPVADALLGRSGVTLAEAQRRIEDARAPHSFALGESATAVVALKRTRAEVRNLIGRISGADTTRTIVIGAHYDHLGYGGESSLASGAEHDHAVHPGADDNASGVAAMLGVARRMSRRVAQGWRPAHTLLFCAFTGEEMGLVGSSEFVGDPPRPLESVEVMLNMDMVGRLRDNRLLVMGVGTAREFPALVQNVNHSAGFDLKTSSDGYGPSDHSSFYKRQIPVLMLFTGAHTDYHRPSDTWDKINTRGLWRVTQFESALVESLDARPRPTYQQAKSDSSTGRIAGGGGYGAYLGTIPDYMQTEGGVLLSGVRSGSPAELGGLRGGDVIVSFDGVRIDNIYDYTFALRSRKPGQSVRVIVKRNLSSVPLTVTLGRRP
jgi:Peptidase family M28/PDZ domain/PA domain